MNGPKYQLNLTKEQYDRLEEAANLLILKHQFIKTMEDAVERLAGNFIFCNTSLLSHWNK